VVSALLIASDYPRRWENLAVVGRLFLGTSGFAYDEWRGTFYPADIRPRDMLASYAARLDSVEINYTFRKHPAARTVERWREAVSGAFVFSVKANQQITHWRRLVDAEEVTAGFLAEVRPLGPHLGPVLFQCPPNLELDAAVLSSFLDPLPADLRYAFEFRHPSWAEARTILAERGIAWCSAETDEEPFELPALLAEPFAYLRLRKTAYSDDELRTWAQRIESALDRGRDVYCYVKHEEQGVGPKLAARLGELVGRR
jgi:uncharacterized protein YecE (DUF72 family)